MVVLLKNRRGQTSVEWLMLMAAASLTAFVVISGPISNFTIGFVKEIRDFTQNIVLRGESDPKAPPPSDPKRFRPVHL